MIEELLYLALLIITAKLLGEITSRLKQPSLLGYVLAGVLLGPSVLAVINMTEILKFFMEIGILLLFFLVGFEEIDVPGLFSVMRRRLFLAVVFSFVAPLLIAYFFFTWLGFQHYQALAVSTVVNISSLGVVAKALLDLGRLRHPMGLEIFSAVAILEFVGLIIASIMIQMAVHADASPWELAWIPVKIAVFFVAVSLLGVKVFPALLRMVRRHLKVREITFGLLFGLLLLIVYLAELSGLHGAFGALLVGMALAPLSKEVHYEIAARMHGIAHGVFIPVFFAGIGLLFDLSFIHLPALTAAGFILLVSLVRFCCASASAKALKLTAPLAFGAGMMAKGAVDLALMTSLYHLKIIPKELLSLYIFSVLSIIVAFPAILKISFRKLPPLETEDAREAVMPVYARIALSRIKAREVMRTDVAYVSSTLTVGEFLRSHLDVTRRIYFAVDPYGKLLGVVSLKKISKLPRNLWETTLLTNVIKEDFVKVYPDEDLYSVTEKIVLADTPAVPVVDPVSDKILGTISRYEIVRLLVRKPS